MKKEKKVGNSPANSVKKRVLFEFELEYLMRTKYNVCGQIIIPKSFWKYDAMDSGGCTMRDKGGLKQWRC